jgi:outer membrane lipopolysaccharide assembly protein LptE/RlpB
MKRLFLLSAALLLAACGSKLDGTYTDGSGMMSYTFKSNGKMAQTVMGTEVEMNYEVDGNKVKLITPQGKLVMTLLEDGSIQGPMGMKLTKQKK